MLSKQDLPTPPRVGYFGTRHLNGKIEIYWFVENADTVEIRKIVKDRETGEGTAFIEPTTELDASRTVDMGGAERLQVVLIATKGELKTRRYVTITPRIIAQVAEAQLVPEGTERHELPNKSDHGYLVVESKIQDPKNPIKPADPGKCPACGRSAPDYTPPDFSKDRKYQKEFQRLKASMGNATDKEIHETFLKRTGGWVAQCTCGTSFFVPTR